MADYTAPVAGNLFDSPDLDFYAASQSGSLGSGLEFHSEGEY